MFKGPDTELLGEWVTARSATQLNPVPLAFQIVLGAGDA